MRFLLDTCILTFSISDQLDRQDKKMIFSYEHQLYTSSVAVMELIHLLQFGRITLSKKGHFDALNVFDFVENTLGSEIKYIDKGHLRMLAQLPTFSTHKDPNDRLMIAQAIAENLTLLSSDTQFDRYVAFGLDFIKAHHS